MAEDTFTPKQWSVLRREWSRAINAATPTKKTIGDMALDTILTNEEVHALVMKKVESVVAAKHARKLFKEIASDVARDTFPKLGEQHGINDKVSAGVNRSLRRYSERLTELSARLDSHIARWALFSVLGNRLSNPDFCARAIACIGMPDDWWRALPQRERTTKEWIDYIKETPIPDWGHLPKGN